MPWWLSPAERRHRDLLAQLAALETRFMAKIDDINAKLDEIGTTAEEIAGDLDEIKGELAGGVSASEADAVITRLGSLSERLRVIADVVPEPEVPPTE